MAIGNEARLHLENCLIPFWRSLRDPAGPGYIGEVTFDLDRKPKAVKGCILNSRILYFFSSAYKLLGDPALLDEANHALEMLLRMSDMEYGGMFWSVHPDGRVYDSTKHTYNQAFAIYALSAYADAAGSQFALEKAFALFDLIETRFRDEIGYLESMTRDYCPESNEKLSENGVMAFRTMNTLLHVLEAYTELYRVSQNEKVRVKLYEVIDAWEAHIYNQQLKRQEVFFDNEWNSLIDLHSFGHDIETSWLMDRTLEILNDEHLTQRIRPKLMNLAQKTYELAMTDHGFANEMENGVIDTTRIWWVQAEALVGFLNAWQKTGEEKFRQAVLQQWTYIQKTMVDSRPGSEWFWSVCEDGKPIQKPIVEPWKCPYHNGRMTMEMIRRLGNNDL